MFHAYVFVGFRRAKKKRRLKVTLTYCLVNWTFISPMLAERFQVLVEKCLMNNKTSIGVNQLTYINHNILGIYISKEFLLGPLPEICLQKEVECDKISWKLPTEQTVVSRVLL